MPCLIFNTIYGKMNIGIQLYHGEAVKICREKRGVVTMNVSEDYRTKVKLTSENMNRVRYTALVLVIFTPVVLLCCLLGGIATETRGLVSLIFGGFEIIYFSYYVLAQLIFKKKEYMLIDVVRYSFWAMVVVFGLMVTFIGYLYNKDLSAYYVMLCALTVIALLSFKELIVYMSIQFAAITAMSVFFSMTFFQWLMILFANMIFFVASRKSRNAYAEVYTMKSKVRKVSKSAEEDPLTGLMNRRGLDRVVEEVWAKNDSEVKVGLIIVDIDYFKLYNDNFGHPQGDVCLKKVSEVIRYYALQEGAVPSRIGGEEFVVFMNDISEKEIVVLAEKIRAGVENIKLEQSPTAPGKYVTISLGAAVKNCDREITFADLYDEADKALYRAKNSGKNITVYKNHLYKK